MDKNRRKWLLVAYIGLFILMNLWYFPYQKITRWNQYLAREMLDMDNQWVRINATMYIFGIVNIGLVSLRAHVSYLLGHSKGLFALRAGLLIFMLAMLNPYWDRFGNAISLYYIIGGHCVYDLLQGIVMAVRAGKSKKE